MGSSLIKTIVSYIFEKMQTIVCFFLRIFSKKAFINAFKIFNVYSWLFNNSF